MESAEGANSACAFIFSGHGAYDERARSSAICNYDGAESGYIYDSDLATAFYNFESMEEIVYALEKQGHRLQLTKRRLLLLIANFTA